VWGTEVVPALNNNLHDNTGPESMCFRAAQRRMWTTNSMCPP
jgi:hypothetical protein